ncbi:hypothetical protein ABZV14_40915 [Streptosporangium canum]|uniref:hypothetical protein n=1 Tax=Streptosporangium canum TaxID=324952 RepID=UPI0033A80A50
MHPKNHPGTRAREVRRGAGRVRARESITTPDDRVSRVRLDPDTSLLTETITDLEARLAEPAAD